MTSWRRLWNREVTEKENARLILGCGVVFLLIAYWSDDPTESSVGALVGGGSLMFGAFVHRRLDTSVSAERLLAQLALPFGLFAWLFVDWNARAVAFVAVLAAASVFGWRHLTRL